MIKFASFELDERRAELRDRDGRVVHLRVKSFELLRFFLANPGVLLSKQELMAAVWPTVHVGEDSLFQCIREIRSALGDEDRALIKVVSGRGYRFDAVVEADGVASAGAMEQHAPVAVAAPQHSKWRLPAAVAIAAMMILIAAIGSYHVHDSVPTIAVRPLVVSGNDLEASLGEDVRSRLVDGLARIESLQVLASRDEEADYLVTAELRRTGAGVEVHSRVTAARSNEIRWTASASIDPVALSDAGLAADRLSAAIGHPLAGHLGTGALDTTPTATRARVAIEQANQQIAQASLERFIVARSILETALVKDSASIELQVALSALLLRAVQTGWYVGDDAEAATAKARQHLERALRSDNGSIAAHEAYCRLLSATNQFVEALVACAEALTLDPWNGGALYNMGLSQLYLGRFEDALATFRQAHRFGTPETARWTWTLGIGWALALLDRPAEAVGWLEQSVAITPASGRPQFVLAATYQMLGRTEEAAQAIAAGLKIRPGSKAANVRLPEQHASTAFVAASDRMVALAVAAGLPQ